MNQCFGRSHNFLPRYQCLFSAKDNAVRSFYLCVTNYIILNKMKIYARTKTLKNNHETCSFKLNLLMFWVCFVLFSNSIQHGSDTRPLSSILDLPFRLC